MAGWVEQCDRDWRRHSLLFPGQIGGLAAIIAASGVAGDSCPAQTAWRGGSLPCLKPGVLPRRGGADSGGTWRLSQPGQPSQPHSPASHRPRPDTPRRRRGQSQSRHGADRAGRAGVRVGISVSSDRPFPVGPHPQRGQGTVRPGSGSAVGFPVRTEERFGMLVCGGVPAAGAFSPQPRSPCRKTSMVFDVKLVDEHVYVLVDDEVRTGWLKCMNAD